MELFQTVFDQSLSFADTFYVAQNCLPIQYKLSYTISNNIEVNVEPVPQAKNKYHCAVRPLSRIYLYTKVCPVVIYMSRPCQWRPGT